MEPNFKDLFSLNTVVYCLAVWLIVLVIRGIVEKACTFINSFVNFSDKSKKKFLYVWEELILPVVPLVVGGIGALYFSALFPVAFVSPIAHRIIFGIVCGSFAGVVYRMAKQYILTVLPQQIKSVVQAFLNAEVKQITGVDPVAPPVTPVANPVAPIVTVVSPVVTPNPPQNSPALNSVTATPDSKPPTHP